MEHSKKSSIGKAVNVASLNHIKLNLERYVTKLS